MFQYIKGSAHVKWALWHIGTADRGVKMEKNPGVIIGRFYVTTSLSDSWEPFTPLHAGVTLGRFLH